VASNTAPGVNATRSRYIAVPVTEASWGEARAGEGPTHKGRAQARDRASDAATVRKTIEDSFGWRTESLARYRHPIQESTTWLL
jgi:hypothetical protein